MGYQPYKSVPRFVDKDGRAVPPQSESLTISSIERFMMPQSYDPNKSSYVPPMRGVTVREAAEALILAFGPWASDPIGESDNGIAPCGYDEL